MCHKIFIEYTVRIPASGGTQVEKAENVTAESDGRELWAKWEQNASSLADVVEVGDYVNYPVEYENVETFDNMLSAKASGWRVLSKDVDIDGKESPGTINLISAGVPLKYYHAISTDTSIKNLTIDFLNTSATSSNEGYRINGFDSTKTLTEVFTNKYTDTYTQNTTVSYSGYSSSITGTKEAGDLKVRAFTKDDVDRVYGSTTGMDTNLLNKNYDGLLSVPTTDGYYAQIWLASASSNFLLYITSGSGLMSQYGNASYGVRPVVSLKIGVATTGQDANGVWQLQ